MSTATQRILLGPGPSLMSARVMQALARPMLSHLDPEFVGIMDDVRARLMRVFQAPEGSFAFAVSGTGTSAMETAVANLISPGTRVLSIVTGYFGDRLAQMATRYGAEGASMRCTAAARNAWARRRERRRSFSRHERSNEKRPAGVFISTSRCLKTTGCGASTTTPCQHR